jgi:hypothetical protein
MTTEAKIKNTYTEQSKRTEDFKPPKKEKTVYLTRDRIETNQP